MAGLDGGHPVAHRLVDGVLQRAAAAVHGFHFTAEQLHAEHVERLPLDVDRPHVDLALHAQQGCRRRTGDAMLPGAGLRDQPLLAHPLGEQGLAEHVVDLVRAGVVEVFSLQRQPNAKLLAEVVALGEDGRAPGVGAQHVVELCTKHRIGPCFDEGCLQLLARGHQGFRDETATELAETTGIRRLGHQ